MVHGPSSGSRGPSSRARVVENVRRLRRRPPSSGGSLLVQADCGGPARRKSDHAMAPTPTRSTRNLGSLASRQPWCHVAYRREATGGSRSSTARATALRVEYLHPQPRNNPKVPVVLGT